MSTWKWLKFIITGKNPQIEPDNKIYLHGFDLAKWCFLGNSKIDMQWLEADGKVKCTDEIEIFFFCDRNNSEKREYVTVTENYILKRCEKRHEWLTKQLPMWKANQYYITQCIQEPSDELIQMMNKNGYSWNKHSKKWEKITDIKKKQVRTKKIKEAISKEIDNVVKIDFGDKK